MLLRPVLAMGLVVAGLVRLGTATAAAPEKPAGAEPEFLADGQLKFPAAYREWVFLTSGMDMSYSADGGGTSHSTFDNVFVNPVAYGVFLKTGTWPDGTELVLENRGAEGAVSLNKRGKTQSAEVMGLEVHV